jgi:hypothetical protein
MGIGNIREHGKNQGVIKNQGVRVNLPQFNGHFKSETIVSQRSVPTNETQTL